MSKADLALVFSAGALAWNVYNAIRLDKPRLTVRMSPYSIGNPLEGRPEEVFMVSVVNTGKRATRVVSIWVMFGEPPRPWPRWFRPLLPKKLRRGSSHMYLSQEGNLAESTRLPVRLDVGDDATLVVNAAHLRCAGQRIDAKWIYAIASSTSAGSQRTRRVALAASPST